MKFKVHGIRESRVWKEAHEEGKTEAKPELIQKWVAKGMTEKQLADLLDISVTEVRRLANGHSQSKKQNDA